MTQTFTYSFGKLLSIALGVSVLFGATHAKDVSAFTLPTYSSLFNNSKQTDNNPQNTYKIHVEHHNHIDKVSLKSTLNKMNKQTPQADAKSLHRSRHGSPKKVSKKQKHNDAWHLLLHQAV